MTVPVRILTIPGLHNSGPGHWQTRWDATLPGCSRVDLDNWDNPDPFRWIEAIEAQARSCNHPAVLVAHSLGCLAVVHWAARYASRFDPLVRGALLVAPCDPLRPGTPPAITRFLPLPESTIPFRTVVVASTDDPFATIERSRCLAERWGSDFVNAGAAGHINGDSGLGDWMFGQVLLDNLLWLAASDDARRLRNPQWAALAFPERRQSDVLRRCGDGGFGG